MVETTDNTVAIVDLTRFVGQFEQGTCSPLIPLVDRPFVQHVIEAVALRGIRRLTFVVTDDVQPLRTELGTGQRWGVNFDFQTVRSSHDFHQRLARFLRPSDAARFLFVDATYLQPQGWAEAFEQRSKSKVFTFKDTDKTTRWAGSALIHSKDIDNLATRALECSLEQRLVEFGRQRGALVEVAPPLRGHNFEALLAAQDRALSGETHDALDFGTQAEDGIWIRRGVCLHPSTQFVPPVYIGEHVEIAEAVRLGPNTVISNGSVIDAKSEIVDTFVGGGSFVGEGLHVDACIVDRFRLFHTKLDVAVQVNDPRLMGPLKPNISLANGLQTFAARLLAATILLAFSPLVVVMVVAHRLRFGTFFEEETDVKLPMRVVETPPNTFQRFRFRPFTHASSSNLGHFLYEFLPGLINVVKGECRWVGVRPIPIAMLDTIPPEWKDLYFSRTSGLIHESLLMFGATASDDERLTAEVCFATTVKSSLARLQRVAMYLVSLVRGPRALRSLPNNLPTNESRATLS